MKDNKTFSEALEGMPGIITVKVKEVNIRWHDGDYLLEVVPEPMLHVIGDLMPSYAEIARAQYQRERDRAGDPPYSIGNDWLLEFADECS